MKQPTKSAHYVVCVRNEGYEASLERRKIYRLVPNKKAAQQNLMKVIDESGESYLYPEALFVQIKLPQPILRAFSNAA